MDNDKKHGISDLRDHLFETLAGLRDKQNPLDIDRARAVSDIAKVIVESAKVEVDFLKVTGAVRSTGFLPIEEDVPPPRQLPPKPAAPPPTPSAAQKNGNGHEVVFSGARGESLIGARSSRPRA